MKIHSISPGLPHQSVARIFRYADGLLLPVVACLLLAQTTRATLYLTEPFDYPSPAGLTNAIPWSTNGTAVEVSTNATLLLMPGDLAYPPLTDPQPVNHTKFQFSNNVRGARLISSTPLTGIIYASFIFYKATTNGTTANTPIIGFESLNTANLNVATSDGMVLYHQQSGGVGNYHFGIRIGGGNSAATYPTGTQFYSSGNTSNGVAGQTNFIVMKYTFNGGGGNDTCALWVNPDPSTFGGSEPAATTNDVPANTGSGTPVDAAAGLQLIQVRGGASGASGAIQLDNIRVGSTWADVTPTCTPVGIITPPANTAVSTNQSATFSIVASGASPTYQWQTNNGASWNNIVGAINPTYTTPPEPLAANGLQFRCVVSVACDSTTTNSPAATLTVVTCLTAGVTLTSPANQTVNVGDAVTNSVTGTGTAPTYQWQQSFDLGNSWTRIVNATNATYITPPQPSVATNLYDCVVSNACDHSSVTSSVASVVVICTSAGISAVTGNNSVTGGATTTLSVTGSGSHPTYQWATNGVNIIGATNSSYTTPPVTEIPYDGIIFSCTVTVACDGSTATSSAQLSVNCATVGDAGDPVSTTVGAGTTATFTALANGSLPMYQWQKSTDGGASFQPIGGATNTTYTTPVLTTADNNSQYDCLLSVYCDGSSVTTAAATLSVLSSNAWFKSVQSGNVDDPNTWQVSYDGGASFNPAQYPPVAASSTNITVQNTHIVTVESNSVEDQLVVQAGGKLVINTNITLTVTNGTGTDLDISGTVDVTGTLNILTNSPVMVESGGGVQTEQGGTETGPTNALTFKSGGIYVHNYTTTSGTLPNATWNTGSTCEVAGFTTSTATLAGLVQDFYNFVWNCPNQTAALPWGGSVPSVGGDLTVISTGTGAGEVRISNNNSPTLPIGGNLNILGGKFTLASGTGKVNLSVSNNVYVASGGILNNATNSSGNNASIHFARGSGTQMFTNAGSITGPITWFVDPGSTLNGVGLLSSNLVVSPGGKILLSTANPAMFSVNNNVTSSNGTAVVNLGGNTVGVGSYLIMNYGGNASGTFIPSIVNGSVTGGTAAIDGGMPNQLRFVVIGRQPGIAGFSLSGSTLSISGTNGTTGISYGILSTTNLALPLSQWTPGVSKAFTDGSGNFSTNVTINVTNQQQFYILRSPSP